MRIIQHTQVLIHMLISVQLDLVIAYRGRVCHLIVIMIQQHRKVMREVHTPWLIGYGKPLELRKYILIIMNLRAAVSENKVLFLRKKHHLKH